ncbi:HAD family hydrolase [Thermomonospora umbrina]|uniref:Phosphoglycolate phosphatase n=1 Tax=Thermomonospora umbrina TaxID=111806 RepID=A0A3D9SK38_9ACTN|nr:HAD family hydrolase [Thermomonospora umbrina]REE96259.1 phosphoglycolate phosphatase [Thermomonospora umbrina]
MPAPPAAGAKGIIFDLDGTLADTPQAITAILMKILADRGATPGEARVRAVVGRPLEPALAGLLALSPDHPVVTTAVDDYKRRFREHLRDRGAELAYPGVPEGLSALRADGRLLGIATSKPRGAAERMLGLMNVAEEFRAVAGHDTVRRGKPDPEMALHVAAALGLAPAECVVVGDGVGDVEMGAAAGMEVIGVTYGVATGPELLAAGAARTAGSFAELMDLLLPTPALRDAKESR